MKSVFWYKQFKLYNNTLLISQQAKAEQEEEYISNTLLKKIQALKKEKETLAHHYEREEECLTNDLSRKLNQVCTYCYFMYCIMFFFHFFVLG